MNINIAAEPRAASKPPFEIERLVARLGAEIHGLDLKQEAKAETNGAKEATDEGVPTPAPEPADPGGEAEESAEVSADG